MADNSSFDITTGCDLQEVDNAVNQAQKELAQRYDFKNVKFTIEFKCDENKIFLACPDENKLTAVWDVLQTKMIRRGVSIKNLDAGKVITSAGSTVRQEITLKQGIEAGVLNLLPSALLGGHEAGLCQHREMGRKGALHKPACLHERPCRQTVRGMPHKQPKRIQACRMGKRGERR